MTDLAPRVVETSGTTSAPHSARGPRRGGSWLRRHRTLMLIVTGGLLAVVVATLSDGDARTTAAMDPANPGPDGTRALARELDRDGVEVVVVRSADELARADVDADTTVVVTSPNLLGRSTVRRLSQDTAGAAFVVVAGAGPGATRLLDAGTAPVQLTESDGRAAGCADPRFSGLTLAADRAVGYPDGDCFVGRSQGRSTGLVAQPEQSALDAPLVLLGAAQALTNDQVLRADNAAVGLRLLGQHPRLVWYVPSLEDLAAGDGVSLRSLLPPWLLPGLWLNVLALLALVWWRARRLGPLATEPLPVVVRAVETTLSLGRLYRRAGDRAHAAEALRRAARARLAARLRLGSFAAPDAVLREVARRTGRRPDDVARVLGPDGDVPSTDRDLITLADALAELDDEVPRR